VAVYTELGAEALAAIVAEYDIGELVSAKGIAEGVSNSNWLIETTGADGAGSRFILTMYERRIDIGELPFFLGLLDHLADRHCPVPRTIHDRAGRAFRFHEGPDGPKAIALIEFLPGVSVSTPMPAQARAVGIALAQLHLAAADYAGTRANGLGPGAWRELAEACGEAGLDGIDAGLGAFVTRELDRLAREWPLGLPASVIHADLFPDNVLMLGDAVSGMIDFYFACVDIVAYDVAVTHAAWCFSGDGRGFDPALSAALLDGYTSVRPLSLAERAALPVLAQGASMRFLMTRAYDWMHTPADALVTRKDPLAYARRLAFYADPANAALFSV
jgi:homoserine kinase type II